MRKEGRNEGRKERRGKKVVERRKDDRSRLMYFDSGDFLIRATVDIPVTQANVFKVRNNVRLNALGGGLVVGTVDAMISVT